MFGAEDKYLENGQYVTQELQETEKDLALLYTDVQLYKTHTQTYSMYICM